MYVGTAAGQVYMTQTAGGGNGARLVQRFARARRLAGQADRHQSDPRLHAAYAVTTTGVFFIRDSVLLSQNPTNPAYAWVNVTGNVREPLVYDLRPVLRPNTDPNAISSASRSR